MQVTRASFAIQPLPNLKSGFLHPHPNILRYGIFPYTAEQMIKSWVTTRKQLDLAYIFFTFGGKQVLKRPRGKVPDNLL
jgi:hypothetical protein